MPSGKFIHYDSTGPVNAADMGITLPHEHVLVDFIS
jgi:predicted metal-dependent phosphotriesterase family hydrolase